MTIAQFEWDHWPEAIRAANETAPDGIGGPESAAVGLTSLGAARLGDRAGAAGRSGWLGCRRPARQRASGAHRGCSWSASPGRGWRWRAAPSRRRGSCCSPRWRRRRGAWCCRPLLAELAELGARTGSASSTTASVRRRWSLAGARAHARHWARRRARGAWWPIADGRWDDGLADLQTALQRFQEFGHDLGRGAHTRDVAHGALVPRRAPVRASARRARAPRRPRRCGGGRARLGR